MPLCILTVPPALTSRVADAPVVCLACRPRTVCRDPPLPVRAMKVLACLLALLLLAGVRRADAAFDCEADFSDLMKCFCYVFRRSGGNPLNNFATIPKDAFKGVLESCKSVPGANSVGFQKRACLRMAATDKYDEAASTQALLSFSAQCFPQ